MVLFWIAFLIFVLISSINKSFKYLPELYYLFSIIFISFIYKNQGDINFVDGYFFGLISMYIGLSLKSKTGFLFLKDIKKSNGKEDHGD